MKVRLASYKPMSRAPVPSGGTSPLGDEVLVVFRAADAYISPNWYRCEGIHLHAAWWMGEAQAGSDEATSTDGTAAMASSVSAGQK